MGCPTPTRFSIACLLGVLLLPGCAASLTSISAGQIGCRPDEITIVEETSGWGTRNWVAVCHERRHQCSEVRTGRGGSQIDCTTEDPQTASARQARTPTPAEATERTPTSPPVATESRRAEIAAALAAASDAVLACLPGTPRVEMAVLVAPQGDIYDFRAPQPLGHAERDCLEHVFMWRRAPRAPAAVFAWVRFPDERRHAPPVAALAPATTAPPPVPIPAPIDDSTRLRTLLDAQRNAILTCTERANVAVTARWDATGTVTIALGGDLAGTPAEGCVRSAVGAQHVPADTPGELRHLVR